MAGTGRSDSARLRLTAVVQEAVIMDDSSSLQTGHADRIPPFTSPRPSQGTGTPNEVELGPVRRSFERSRLEEEVLRGVYEQVLPRSFWSLGRPNSVPRSDERQRRVGG
jgi:hypothetical protein